MRFILSVRSDFHMTDYLSLAVHALASRELMSVSIDVCLSWWATASKAVELVY